MKNISSRLQMLKNWQDRNESQGIELIDLFPLPEEITIAGLDLAERVDSSAFFGMIWDGVHLKQQGTAVWPHIKYKTIVEHVETIQEKFQYDVIGFDETGVGIAVGQMFSSNLPMEAIQLTNKTKLDCIRVVQWLMQHKILKIRRNDQVVKELLEQEKIITDAGSTTYKHPKNRHDDLFWAMAIGCYFAVPYLIGMPPAAIVTADDDKEQDVDEIVQDVMSQYSHKFDRYS